MMSSPSSDGTQREPIGSTYLSDALRELLAIGTPAVLYDGLPPDYLQVPNQQDQLRRQAYKNAVAKSTRVRLSRQAVLMTAFAAEAYVNGFLLAHLSNADFAAADRLSTKEKYAVGVRLVIGDEAFPRGESPWNEISELFGVRDKLVHPKPAELPADPAERTGWLYEKYRPHKVATYILAVARAASTLEMTTSADRTGLLWIVNLNADKIRDYGRRVDRSLPDLNDEPWLTMTELGKALETSARQAFPQSGDATPAV